MPLALDRSEPRLDLDQPCFRGGHGGRQFGPPQPQHAAQFLDAYLPLDDVPHLPKGEAEVLERDDAVQAGELGGGVVAVAAGGVDVGRAQQAGGVVVTQHPDRDAAVPGEVSDGEHDVSESTA
ncbi:hypothetical protein GCM10018980_14860 [Streptomyces capoamus]|uniref:Uncharacterized protein n=1 Tax=Streptomyces capoamus TaxID=68183 RepID=A0A919C1S1_9ACTN|nr:hypothetical protein GCM10018980_14860 [Streptomyces capoamus]